MGCSIWRRCCKCSRSTGASVSGGGGGGNDTQPPTPVINAPAQHDGVTPFVVSINWDEGVTGFDVGDITVTGPATLGGFAGGPQNYTVNATPFLFDNIVFDIAAGVAQDLAGNLSLAAATVTVISPPTVTITAPATHDTVAPFFVQFDFNQPVTGFTIGDIVITGGTLASFVGPSPGVTYTVQVTPTHTGNITIDVPAGVAIDGDGNGNTAATQVVVTPVDLIAPTIAVTADVATHDGAVGTPFNLTFTWSESPILGFVVGDVTITNANLSAFTQTMPDEWTAVATPIADFITVTVVVPPGSATDTAGNNSLGSPPLLIPYSP